MSYTWADTNRWYAQAKASGEPSQLAFVSRLRSKLTARRNRRASHAHSVVKHVPSGAHTGAHSAISRPCTGDGIPRPQIRPTECPQAPDTDHICDTAHGARRYHYASELIREFGDVLSLESIDRLQAIKDGLESAQPANGVREVVKASLRRW